MIELTGWRIGPSVMVRDERIVTPVTLLGCSHAEMVTHRMEWKTRHQLKWGQFGFRLESYPPGDWFRVQLFLWWWVVEFRLARKS